MKTKLTFPSYWSQLDCCVAVAKMGLRVIYIAPRRSASEDWSVEVE
jgi:hypothetical protein